MAKAKTKSRAKKKTKSKIKSKAKGIWTMGETLTWEGSASNIRKKPKNNEHVIEYAGAFVCADLCRHTYKLKLRVADGTSACEVAKLFVSKWRQGRDIKTSYVRLGKDKHMVTFSSDDGDVAGAHAFKTSIHKNGVHAGKETAILNRLKVSARQAT